MSKLFKLKEWVTIPEAARHLSQMLAEPVSETDILQMTLNGHIKISVHFPNTATAKIGKIIPFKDVQITKTPDVTNQRELTIVHGYLLDENTKNTDITEDTPFIFYDDTVSIIDGVWDLPMRGNEKIDIEFELQQKIGGPEVTMVNIAGTFLNRPDGTWAALQEQFPDQVMVDDRGKEKKIKGDYFPAGGLGDDCIKVIRTSEIINFQRKLDERGEGNPPREREHTTYLNIIGALLELLAQKDAATIDAILMKYPTSQGLKKRTLEGKFAEARRSLKSG